MTRYRLGRNLVGLAAAWSEIFDAAEAAAREEGRKMGIEDHASKDIADAVVFGIHAVLKRWAAVKAEASR